MSSEDNVSESSPINDVVEKDDGSEKTRGGIRGLRSFGKKINIPQTATGRMEFAASNLSKMKKTLGEKAIAKKEELKIKKDEFKNRMSSSSSSTTTTPAGKDDGDDNIVTVVTREVSIDDTKDLEINDTTEDNSETRALEPKSNASNDAITPTVILSESQTEADIEASIPDNRSLLKEPSRPEHSELLKSSEKPEPQAPISEIDLNREPRSGPESVSLLDLPEVPEQNEGVTARNKKRDAIASNLSKMKKTLNEKAKAKKEELKVKKEGLKNRIASSSSSSITTPAGKDGNADDVATVHTRDVSTAVNDEEHTSIATENKNVKHPESDSKAVDEDKDLINKESENAAENDNKMATLEEKSNQSTDTMASTVILSKSQNEADIESPIPNISPLLLNPSEPENPVHFKAFRNPGPLSDTRLTSVSETNLPSTSPSGPESVSLPDMRQVQEQIEGANVQTRKRDKIKSAIGKFVSSKEKSNLTSILPTEGKRLSLTSRKTPQSSYPTVKKLEDGTLSYRVKPFSISEEPKYMTEKEISQNSMKPSTKFFMLQSLLEKEKQDDSMTTPLLSESTVSFAKIWNDPKDGRIGSLSIEVLGALGFQKFDRFTKPNVFVNMVCGDTHFVTDVIPSTNSPMWPNCSNRAAVIPIFHTYARLFLGVFHEVKKEKSNDRFLGRTIVDVSALRPNSIYDVWMPLKSSSFVYDRRPRGAIHIRFSVHWFDERSVVLSYLSSPQDIGGIKTLPITCTDPKKFRNIVLTSYGEDLPNKYSPRAFRAIMRELSLYRTQLEFLLANFLTDTMMYKRPSITLYLFIAWMHCVYLHSLAYIPSYFFGFLILHLMRNYFFYCSCYTGHSGFKPVVLSEIVQSLLFGCGESGETCGKAMKPLNVPDDEKDQQSGCFKRRQQFQEMGKQSTDHTLFPFSEKQSYRQLTISESLVDKRKLVHSSLDNSKHSEFNRLSESEGTALESKENDEYDMDAEQDEEEMIFDQVDNDSDDESDYDEFGNSMKDNTAVLTLKKGQSFPTGPLQDVDIISKKPVQIRKLLLMADQSLQSATGHIFEEKYYEFQNHNGEGHTKGNKNEFTKRIGAKKISSNPLVNYTAQFLEPVMNILKIVLLGVRLGFNISTWKDPILSFWVLSLFTLLMLILIVFPWQKFFLVVGVIALGPQNFLIASCCGNNDDEDGDNNKESDDDEKTRKRDKAKDFLYSSKNKLKRAITKKKKKNVSDPNVDESLKQTPNTCDVLVPYTRWRMDRFYYWPPDPSFSNARKFSPEKIASVQDDDNIVFSTKQTDVSEGNDSYGTFQ